MAVRGMVCVDYRLFKYLLILYLLWLNRFSEGLRSHVQVLEARQLFTYNGYKDVQIFHYFVPQQALLAEWTFTAVEDGGCPSQPVAIYLQHGSYPIINPDNGSFPSNFYLTRSSLVKLDMESDNNPYTLNVTSPKPDDWFVVAFLPLKNNRIEQKGLFPPCKTMLSSTLKCFTEENVVYLLPGVSMLPTTETPQHYKFFVPENTWNSKITLKNCATRPILPDNECPIQLYVQSDVLYTPKSTAQHWVNCSEAYNRGQCVLEFTPQEATWHYIWLDIVGSIEVKVRYEITVETAVCENGYSPSQYLVLGELKLSNSSMPSVGESMQILPNSTKRVFVTLPFARTKTEAPDCWTRISLLKKTFPGNFVFNYEEIPSNATSASTSSSSWANSVIKVNVSNFSPTLLVVPIQPLVDIGGTIAFELMMDSHINTTLYNVSVIACIAKDTRAFSNGLNNCTSSLNISVNTSSDIAMAGQVLMPFPEPGNWYVTLAAYCYLSADVSLHHSEQNLSVYNIVPCEVNTTTVGLSVLSSSCIFGTCGYYGRCYQYISGGFIFSTCVCEAGWKGWACTDGTYATPKYELLLSVLLLTLSNLLFIPAVILALYRKFFVEALVYFLTMFFSVFYHACDEETYSFCMMRLGVLQFCDFYLAILSIWVTIIAMADLPQKIYSVLHMAGAVGVALGVEYDRTGLWVFIVPSVTGLVILTTSWIWHCKQQNGCYPEKKVWFLCLFPGVLLSSAGLACFAFLETEDNYQYIHSGWHAAMALCIVFLLPKSQSQTKGFSMISLSVS
ncbi:hypothetical protein CHUAL_004680 [Chamberlinius hualienensis]